MHAIYKYELGCLEKQTIELPQDAKIIRVCDLDGKFWLWAMVNTNPDCPKESRKIEMYKTGMPIDNCDGLVYLGLCCLYVMQELGLYTFERIG
jgi:hypothetical protein